MCSQLPGWLIVQPGLSTLTQGKEGQQSHPADTNVRHGYEVLDTGDTQRKARQPSRRPHEAPGPQEDKESSDPDSRPAWASVITELPGLLIPLSSLR